MKLQNANAIRAKFLDLLMQALADEDVGQIASNSFNFPVVAEDGEEGWVEIVIKVPKATGEADGEGYAKRDEWVQKCADKTEKAKAKAEAKAKKIARDKALREAKAKEKGEQPFSFCLLFLDVIRLIKKVLTFSLLQCIIRYTVNTKGIYNYDQN